MSTESKPAAEALIPQFHFDKLLNQGHYIPHPKGNYVQLTP